MASPFFMKRTWSAPPGRPNEGAISETAIGREGGRLAAVLPMTSVCRAAVEQKTITPMFFRVMAFCLVLPRDARRMVNG